MANISGSQPNIKFCPFCTSPLNNVKRVDMISSGYEKADGSVSKETHTYDCTNDDCKKRFNIHEKR